MTQSTGSIRVSDRGDSRWVVIDNPAARNAYDQEMATRLAEVIEASTDVRSVVITGSPGAFCAGGLLAGLSAPTQHGMRELYRSSLRLFDAVRQCPRPVIAAVNGAAAGGGNELVIACDLAIAAESATFGQTGPRVGSAPVTGATNVLGVQIGEKRAKEMAMLCRRYTAAQALELGLINAVVPDADLESTVQEWCEHIATLSPRYLEITKVSSNIWWNSARDSFAQGIGMLVQAIGSPDMVEGATAFLEKRRPDFRLDQGELPQTHADPPTTAKDVMADYTPNTLHEDIRKAVREMMEPFDDQYWMEHDVDHAFPWEFYNAVAKAGWLGITIPEEYGGGGLGVTEASIVEYEISASGGGMNACSAVHIGIFGFDPIIRHGSEQLKQRFLPRVPTGDLHISFAVTEPDAGTDTTGITTFATKVDGGFRVSGKKVWITKAQEAERMLVLVRTTKREDCVKRTDGMTLLFAEMDPNHVQVREIPKMGRNAVNTNEVFIDDLFVADEDVVGEVGKGFRTLLTGLNAERIVAANAALGIGRAAVRRATAYAKEREVFGRPIGQNQAIAHPLAEAQMRLDAAELMVYKAAWLLDNGYECGPEANMGKFLAADAAFFAADRALQTHGGFGYGKEFHVERYFREARLKRIAPISQEMVLNYLSEHVLGLPRSY